jgi:hypothetical protein
MLTKDKNYRWKYQDASSARLNLLADPQASISTAAAVYYILYPPYHIVFPFYEPRLKLTAAWSRNRRR